MAQELFDEVAKYVRETALLETTLAVLEWDERTGLPADAGGYRAEQATFLSGLIHQRKTCPQYGEKLAKLQESDLVSPGGELATRATIERLSKDYKRNTQLPMDLVQAISKATVLGQQAWEQARAKDDWQMFKPHMSEVYSLRKQEAELIKGDGSLYDALLDQYEEGASSQVLTQTFADLRSELVPLVQELATASSPPSGAAWKRPVSPAKQRSISHWVAEKIGFSFARGRLDETTHPFCTTLGPDDCRILTRFHEDYFPTAFYGTLHEAGHGLYEQGLPTSWFGLPPGTFASLGVHESQSRLWENFVGRSQTFWQWCFPGVTAQLAGEWDGLSAQEVYRDANLIQPSLIRVEADEVTYNLHILIRFEIEQALLQDELKVDDAPDAWNEKYEHYLGIRPPSNKDGILQDVHWSAGLVGYFPTYTLGNLYAAQLMEAAEKELGDLGAMYGKGEFEPLLTWLQTNVHQHGFCYHPSDLVQKACGAELSHKPLVNYLRDKLLPVYGL